MCKKLIIFALASLCSIISSAQSTIYQQSVDNKFEIAMELFSKNNFLSAQSLFAEYINLTKSSDQRNIESQYFYAQAAYNLAQENSIQLLEEFAKKYPYHVKTSLVYLELADHYIPLKEFPKTIEYLEKIDTTILDSEQKTEFEFKLGYCYFNEKKFDRAISHFEKIYQKEHSYTYAVNYYLGYMYYKQKEYDKTMLVLTKAEQNESFKFLVPGMKANVYNKQQKYDTLIAYTKKILSENPEIRSADELTLLTGEAYYQKQKFKPALEYFKKYISKVDKEVRADIYYRIGYCYYMNNENKESVEYFKKINSINDTIGQFASYYLGLAYLKLSNKPFAFAALEQAGMMPFDIKMQEEAYFSACKVKFDLEKFSEAIVLCKTFLKLFPNSINSVECNALISEAYLHSSNYQEAISYIEKLKEKDDRINLTYERVCYYAGLELFNSDKYQEALAMFKKSLLINLDNTIVGSCYFYSGEIYSQGHRFAEAIESYAALFRLPSPEKHPLYYKTRFGIGYCYYNLTMYDKALVHFREYTEHQLPDLNPEIYADALIRLADCNYILKNYIIAYTTYERAMLFARSDFDYILFQKGLMASFNGHKENAKQHFETVINKYPNYPYFDDALYNRALLDFESGSYATSITWYDKLINLKPGSIYLPEGLKKRAIANYNLKNYQNASDDYIRIVNEFPSYFENVNEILEGLSSCYVALGKEEEFKQIVDKFKQSNPSNTAFADLEFKNAVNLYDKQKYPQAIKGFSDFIAAYPNNSQISDAYFFIGESNFRNNDKVEALKAYQKVTEFASGTFRNKAFNRAADIEFALKSYRESLLKYQSLLAYSTGKREQFVANKGIMECYFELNILDSAFYCANLIVQQGGAPVYIQNKANLYLGKIPYLKGNYEEAEDALISTVNISKDSSGAEAQYILGDILYKKNKYKTSLETLFELNNKYKSFDNWVLKSFILIAENYISLKEYFQAKTTLNSIIQNSKNQFYVNLASKKLDQVIALESEELKTNN